MNQEWIKDILALRPQHLGTIREFEWTEDKRRENKRKKAKTQKSQEMTAKAHQSCMNYGPGEGKLMSTT